MKRLGALLLCTLLALTGCSRSEPVKDPVPNPNDLISESDADETEAAEENEETDQTESALIQYTGLDDVELHGYIENRIYSDTISALNSEEYVVEGVKASYISKEHLEEVAYNSQSNVYFGYNLEDLDDLFQGTRYVFTLGEDGNTTVQSLEELQDVSSETVLKNIAIGSGVILVCVTVSSVTGGLGAPAASAIFAMSATSAQTAALSSAVFGSISAGIITGIKTGDFKEAMKAAALAGSEGFKWGALTGAVTGGIKEAFVLKKATKSGLTMNDAAKIQKESLLPMDVVSEMHSFKEYEIYKEANLEKVIVRGRNILIPKDLDLEYVGQTSEGNTLTNLERMHAGKAPIDPVTDKSYQLHHINQKDDATLALLSPSQHGGSNNSILHISKGESEIDREEFKKLRSLYYKYLSDVIFAQ